ncbi:MAG: O-antigen ligase family protein [bacterium]|nr:O-antigen ligase family protein [bacterium]
MIKRQKIVSLFNVIYTAHLILVLLVAFGFLPRMIIPFLTAALAVYLLIIPVEDSAVYFVRSIPFFVAIPIFAGFDSFNMWRIFSILIFVRWGMNLINKNDKSKFKISEITKHPVLISLIFLLFLALLSIFVAQSPILAIKRIIYFTNLSLIGIVIWDLCRKNSSLTERIIKNVMVPTILVTLLGFVQLAMTYFMDINQFAEFWARKVEFGLFGSAWAAIAIKANTWFAYFGDQLSLRMFSVFADSHSFPIFLLLGLPAVFAVSLRRVVVSGKGLKAMFLTRGSLWVVFVPAIFLAAILSGTRGIWAASLGAITMVFIVMFWIKRTPQVKYPPKADKLDIFKYVGSYLIFFFMLFLVAWPIFASPQFLMAKGDAAMMGKRVKSIIDFGETSNSQRIEIWKASIQSIIKHPLLGVGIGNFPVVLGQDLALAKAGSSAHNLYLNIAAEMGILALFAAFWFLWMLIKKVFYNFMNFDSPLKSVYFAACLIFIPWVLIYSLTDVAIFDERAFLLFVITAALIFSQNKTRLNF